jgi:predicted GTPase
MVVPKMFSMAEYWRTKQPQDEKVKASPLFDSYNASALKAFKQDEERFAVYMKRYRDLIAHFESIEATPVTCLVVNVEAREVRFTPSKIDETKIGPTQKQCELMLRAVWSSGSIQIIYDFRDMTYADICRLISNCGSADMWAGLELWALLPTNVHRIVVCPPIRLWGWSAMVSIGKSFLSAKMKARIVVEKNYATSEAVSQDFHDHRLYRL